MHGVLDEPESTHTSRAAQYSEAEQDEQVRQRSVSREGRNQQVRVRACIDVSPPAHERKLCRRSRRTPPASAERREESESIYSGSTTTVLPEREVDQGSAMVPHLVVPPLWFLSTRRSDRWVGDGCTRSILGQEECACRGSMASRVES